MPDDEVSCCWTACRQSWCECGRAPAAWPMRRRTSRGSRAWRRHDDADTRSCATSMMSVLRQQSYVRWHVRRRLVHRLCLRPTSPSIAAASSRAPLARRPARLGGLGQPKAHHGRKFPVSVHATSRSERCGVGGLARAWSGRSDGAQCPRSAALDRCRAAPRRNRSDTVVPSQPKRLARVHDSTSTWPKYETLAAVAHGSSQSPHESADSRRADGGRSPNVEGAGMGQPGQGRREDPVGRG